MRVTIIIAHQNYQQYLAECLQSAKKQTHKCRICIVDDGSDDRTLTENVIEKELFDGQKPELFYLDETHEEYRLNNDIVIYANGKHGPSYARNLAIDATINDTDYYLILDSDDSIKPHKVATMLDAMTQYNFGVVYADYDLYNVHTGITKREYKEPFSLEALYKHCIVHSGSMISKEALLYAKDIDKNKQFFDERLRCAEDYDLWLRIASRYIIGHIPTCLTVVKVHNQNATESVSKDIWNSCLDIVRQKHSG